MPHLKTSDENIFGGKWSVEKLNCVSAYMKAYLNVFKKHAWADLWYIDAFCGDGFQGLKGLTSSDEKGTSISCSFIEGSAIRSLKIADYNDLNNMRSFDHFAFIEYDKQKLERLNSIVKERFPRQYEKCFFIEGDVNAKLPELLNMIDWSKGRAVSFLDPCSIQVDWKTMETFRGTCSDVWALFPIEAIIRMLPRTKLPPDSWSRRLDIVFGSHEWANLYSQPRSNQLSLFGGVDDGFEREEGIIEVLSFVKERYETVFSGVLDPAILRTEGNSPLFALFALISNDSKRALSIAKRIADSLIKDINGIRL